MTTEQSSSESPSRKRPRRSKQQDPQFIFDNPINDETEINTVETNTNKRTSIKTKTKSLRSVDSTTDTSADLYEPGDIVWCKLGGFPWWPALIYRCTAEGGIHTKTINSNNKPKRLFFVYFYGKYLEYSWISTRWLLNYAGLSNFIQHAEAAVQQATTKSEQQELANRYQLKVSMKKRVQWDEAIELADRALKMTKDERIEEFSELLEDAADQSKTNTRRQKLSMEKVQEKEEEDDDKGNKQPIGDTSISSTAETNEEINAVEKPSISLQKPITFTQNGSTLISTDEQISKKKRGRKPKTETNNNSIISQSTNKEQILPRRSQRKSEIINGNEIEYDYPPSSSSLSSTIHLIQSNNPPLSNYEQKQIVDGLLHHSNEKNLTFDEAQTYAINKAIEIIYENHNYRMKNISPEWFYESILLKYPSIVFKYRSWFEHIKTDVIPNGNDMIKLKQWQIALMLQAQIKAEQQQQSSTNEN